MLTLFARHLGSVIPTTLAILLVTAAGHAQIPCAYEVTAVIQGPWCPIFGFPPTFGRGITEDGAVVGSYNSCVIGPSEAFYWSESTGFVTLDRPPDSVGAAAADIDENGTIAGTLTYQEFGPNGKNEWNVAAMWETLDAQPIELGIPPKGTDSFGAAIDQGQVVGYWANFNTGPLHGFVYEGGVMTDLGPDLGTPSSRANDIKKGKVVGWMGKGFLQDGQAYIWDSGQVIPLANPRDMFSGRAHGISPNGRWVVGAAQLDDGTMFGSTRALLWITGEVIELGTLPGFLRSGASDVTDTEMIIGSAWGPGAASAGIIWYNGLLLDLNSLIPPESAVEVTAAAAINSAGQITALGHNTSGDVVALVLTAVGGPVGDLDGDCQVGILDLLSLLSEWGPCNGCPADLDGYGHVGIIDLLILLANWG
ncbi:MAG: hypothetical protein IH889_05815 [Planctomycetes bacterium]|nr:hypothetical protein [Planctomycetota bacterium]